MIVNSHCDRIHSSLTAVHCFQNGYEGKQPLAWKEYCAEYWLKEFQESMDRCSDCHDITEILLKMTLNTIQSIIMKKMKKILIQTHELPDKTKGKFTLLLEIRGLYSDHSQEQSFSCSVRFCNLYLKVTRPMRVVFNPLLLRYSF